MFFLAKGNDFHIEALKETDFIFGKFDTREDFTIIDHILLLGKYYIYTKKCQKSLPTLYHRVLSLGLK